MTYAIHFNFDKDTDSVIRSLWEKLYSMKLSEYMYESGNIPHVGIAHFNTHSPSRIKDIIDEHINEFDTFKIDFDSFGFFKGPYYPIFLLPAPTKKLLETHNLIHDLVKDEVFDYSYKPDNLTYHCSIALKYDTKHFMKIIEEIKDMQMPIHGFVTGLRLIEIPTKSICYWDIGE